ncbi:MAG: hypothetical protein R6W76_00285 [Caldilinea sp.]
MTDAFLQPTPAGQCRVLRPPAIRSAGAAPRQRSWRTQDTAAYCHRLSGVGRHHRLRRRTVGEITLLSERSTSGKLTLGYKLLASAQHTSAGGVAHTVALLALSCTADPDYVARCGVDLDYLLVGRPPTGRKTVELLGDLMQRHGLHALVVDNLADLTAEPADA